MKTFKIILAIATLAGIAACSSTREKTTEREVAVAPPPPAATEPQLSPAPTSVRPSYTVANLGASSAGRSK